MPWPPQVDRLLARPDTRAAFALRWGLRGLGASLQAAVDDIPDDPGCEDLRKLVAALDSLVGVAGQPSGPTLPADEPGEAMLPTCTELPPASASVSGTIQAIGPRSAAAQDPRVAEPFDAELRPLAGIVSACLSLVESEPSLHHCLQTVFRFGVAPLTGDQRPRYIAELLRRWDRLRTSQGPRERFKAHLDLDEAIQSLVFLPLVDARSWWGQLQSQGRDALLQARDRAVRAGCQVQMQLLGGSFADVNRLAPDSLQVDFGVPGEVVACLRVWARVDGEELKGRVLYRSPREDA
jgi:hypothetical protein